MPTRRSRPAEASWVVSSMGEEEDLNGDRLRLFGVRGVAPGKLLRVAVLLEEGGDVEIVRLELQRDPASLVTFKTRPGAKKVKTPAPAKATPIASEDLRAIKIRPLKRKIREAIPRTQAWAEDYEAAQPKKRGPGRPAKDESELRHVALLRLQYVGDWRGFVDALSAHRKQEVPEGTAKWLVSRAKQSGFLSPGPTRGPRLEQEQPRKGGQ